MLLYIHMAIFPLDAVINKWVVKYQGDEVDNLNELEFVNGEIWANIWMVYSP